MKQILGGKGICVAETDDTILISDYAPNARKHLIVSLIKSAVRMTGYGLMFSIGNKYATAAAIVLLVSEVIGIIEELV